MEAITYPDLSALFEVLSEPDRNGVCRCQRKEDGRPFDMLIYRQYSQEDTVESIMREIAVETDRIPFVRNHHESTLQTYYEDYFDRGKLAHIIITEQLSCFKSLATIIAESGVVLLEKKFIIDTVLNLTFAVHDLHSIYITIENLI